MFLILTEILPGVSTRGMYSHDGTLLVKVWKRIVLVIGKAMSSWLLKMLSKCLVFQAILSQLVVTVAWQQAFNMDVNPVNKAPETVVSSPELFRLINGGNSIHNDCKFVPGNLQVMVD